jgi:DNA-binding response OmpR family regulator
MKRILIVEDEKLLALMLEDLLVDAGYDVEHAFDLVQAQNAIERTPVDAAILDIKLNGSLVFPFARRLRDNKVRFLFASSAYRIEIPPDLCWHPLVRKPYVVDEVVVALKGLFGEFQRAPGTTASWPSRQSGEHPSL